MQEEIDGFNNFINANFIDTFRHLNKEQIKYSWWSYRANARVRNVGWRIDYLLSSKSIIDKIDNAFILNDVFGSDHCPVGVDISL
jgi:exodeoxyribonuclease-3